MKAICLISKLLEERAQEASEFFKSESESEEEVVPNADHITPAAQELQELPTTSSSSSAQAVVTEVLELPRMDMSDLPICLADTALATPTHTPSASVEKPQRSESLRRLLAEQCLGESPKLSGAPGTLIDLDTGEVVHKPLTGVDKLVQRMLATRKSLKSTAASPLSTETERLEVSKVTLNLVDEQESTPGKEIKPGAAFLKLKQNLQSIIKQKRLEKRQQDEREEAKCLGDDEDDAEEEEEEEDDELKQQYDELNEKQTNAINIEVIESLGSIPVK